MRRITPEITIKAHELALEAICDAIVAEGGRPTDFSSYFMFRLTKELVQADRAYYVRAAYELNQGRYADAPR